MSVLDLIGKFWIWTQCLFFLELRETLIYIFKTIVTLQIVSDGDSDEASISSNKVKFKFFPAVKTLYIFHPLTL